MVATNRGGMMRSAAHVLVVGAGPTGLTLALQAHDHGAHVRIIERRQEAFRPSRALILHPRTLEALRPLGVTEPLLAHADTAPEAWLHMGPSAVHVRLAQLALTDTAFPHLSLVRQMDVETTLARALADRGVTVERGVELIETRDGPDCAQATLRSATGLERVECTFIAGCDGPESIVRSGANIGWRGGSYRQEVILADLELDADLAHGVAHVVVGRHGLLLLFALGERATWRLLATRPVSSFSASFGQPGLPVSSGEAQDLLDDAGLDARITKLVWSARYRLQHRLATHFRQGRLFLLGDAAHAYSPATGQGMNTGIQDAVNLGWKLAFAPFASTEADRAALLDSYEAERRPAAGQALAMTRIAFWAEASTDPLASLLRGVFAPLGAPLAPTLLNQRWLTALAGHALSQSWVAYPDSPLTWEGAPHLPSQRAWPRAGQWLPDVAAVTASGMRVRLRALLARPGAHVILQRDAAALERHHLGAQVTIHRLTNMPGAGALIVRPDGYVGCRCQRADVGQAHAWLERIGAATGQPSSSSALTSAE
jgi:2-polyprenyl-6-methoxyphenol hydroxylase-like FAD-dependent oxidoreductase